MLLAKENLDLYVTDERILHVPPSKLKWKLQTSHNFDFIMILEIKNGIEHRRTKSDRWERLHRGFPEHGFPRPLLEDSVKRALNCPLRGTVSSTACRESLGEQPYFIYIHIPYGLPTSC